MYKDTNKSTFKQVFSVLSQLLPRPSLRSGTKRYENDYLCAIL
jgi:hypothetical protein